VFSITKCQQFGERKITKENVLRYVNSSMVCFDCDSFPIEVKHETITIRQWSVYTSGSIYVRKMFI